MLHAIMFISIESRGFKVFQLLIDANFRHLFNSGAGSKYITLPLCNASVQYQPQQKTLRVTDDVLWTWTFLFNNIL